MGNCKCQSDTDMEFQDQSREVVLTKRSVPHKIQQVTPTITPSIVKPPTHEPTPAFAKQIDKFPQLANKIITTDQNLGQFKPSLTNQWNQNNQPIYINKPYLLHNGIIYQGHWNRGAMNGNGVFYLPDGSFVRGFCVDNEMVGEARYIRENGNYYQGQIKDNKANGQGVMYQNGVQFKGYFTDNYLEGKGIQISPDYQFEGNYHRGARIDGRLVWDLQKSIPTVYQGSFFDEQFNGQGKLTNQIGQYVGTFDNGKKKGRGVFTWRNGQRFEGNYDSDLKNGEGKMFNNKNVVVLQGTWQGDRFKN